MNVSWSDLSNVDQAGEYPFRDGTITVTFAEIAVWKKSDQERIYIGDVFFLCRCRYSRNARYGMKRARDAETNARRACPFSAEQEVAESAYASGPIRVASLLLRYPGSA
jgi:hypothetical protein